MLQNIWKHFLCYKTVNVTHLNHGMWRFGPIHMIGHCSVQINHCCFVLEVMHINDFLLCLAQGCWYSGGSFVHNRQQTWNWSCCHYLVITLDHGHWHSINRYLGARLYRQLLIECLIVVSMNWIDFLVTPRL